MDRRAWLLGFGALLAGAAVPAAAANFTSIYARRVDVEETRLRRQRQRRLSQRKSGETKVAKAPRKKGYEGRRVVDFPTDEEPGTIIIKTRERALYHVLGGGLAMRYGVAVGKQGFAWSGTARIGYKAEWPDWTPPAEMIDRVPEYAYWADGMPGGIPENPLGARALYLYQGDRDTQYRIHGTNHPSSIGTAASSGCIRMLNKEVIELYDRTQIGTKVVVL